MVRCVQKKEKRQQKKDYQADLVLHRQRVGVPGKPKDDPTHPLKRDAIPGRNDNRFSIILKHQLKKEIAGFAKECIGGVTNKVDHKA